MPLPAQIHSMPIRRVGIMGCGSRGRAFAAEVASLAAADLVLCIDDDPAAAKDCADAHGGESASDWSGQALDALIMALPQVDADRLQAVVRSGVRVLANPPLARGVVNARRLARAVADERGQVGVAFAWRYEPLLQLVRQILPEPRFAHVFTAVDPGPPQAPTSVRETVWTAPHHALDLLMYLFDAPPAEIVADGGPLPAPRQESAPVTVPPRADALVAELYFDRERHASLTVAGGGADPDIGSVVLDVTDGATRMRVWSDWTVAEILPLAGRSLEPPRIPGVRLERQGRGWRVRVERSPPALGALVGAFVSPVEGGDSVPDLSDGARAVALTRAVLAAAASGRTQMLNAG